MGKFGRAPPNIERIRRKFVYKIEAETLGQRGYGADMHTKSKLKPSGPDWGHGANLIKIEAEILRARGDTAQICILIRS